MIFEISKNEALALVKGADLYTVLLNRLFELDMDPSDSIYSMVNRLFDIKDTILKPWRHITPTHNNESTIVIEVNTDYLLDFMEIFNEAFDHTFNILGGALFMLKGFFKDIPKKVETVNEKYKVINVNTNN
jgi:hypothetical protein